MTNEIFEIKIRILDYDMCAGWLDLIFFLRINDSIFNFGRSFGTLIGTW